MQTKSFIKSVLIIVCVAILGCTGSSARTSEKPGPPYMATGIKIGEVTDTQAIIWTRLTKNFRRVGADAPLPTVRYKDPTDDKLKAQGKGRPDRIPVVTFPEGSDINTIEGATPGQSGKVRIYYSPVFSSIRNQTSWKSIDPAADYTQQFKLTDLQPDTQYALLVRTSDIDGNPGAGIEGTFKTAPKPNDPERVVFTVTTGTSYPDHDIPEGYKIYARMLKLDPSFFVHTGDILYYDKLAKTRDLALYHWQRIYSFPTNVEFHRRVASYFIKDDHDTWKNDCWPTEQTKFMGDFTFEQGKEIFTQQVPMGDKTYRTFRWGKDLQIWLVEGRDYRSPNNMPDGPNKTIWGAQQKQWFKKTVTQSDATFKILISPTPLVGPDRTNKNDNHANAGFTHEGDELRQFISKQKNMFVVCGDRHWQYVSVDKKTGVKEYSCGPASNEHAGGWSNDQRYPEHRYLNVTGGFLAVTIERKDGSPTAIFTHYSVDGKPLNEEINPAD